jgi:hypothetical protein
MAIKTARRIKIGSSFTPEAPGGKIPRGVFAFASWPPLAMSPRGNFPATV